jgi:hypothetical protein
MEHQSSKFETFSIGPSHVLLRKSATRRSASQQGPSVATALSGSRDRRQEPAAALSVGRWDDARRMLGRDGRDRAPLVEAVRDVPDTAQLHETVCERLAMSSVRNFTGFGPYRPAALRNHRKGKSVLRTDLDGQGSPRRRERSKCNANVWANCDLSKRQRSALAGSAACRCNSALNWSRGRSTLRCIRVDEDDPRRRVD